MTATLILTVIVLYFITLVGISFLTSRGAQNATFFTGDKNSKWYLVSYGMIGASLSGVTFISVPGWVEGEGFSYMQMIIGYMIGYAIIAFVLMPLYYKLNLTSIYAYLGERYGPIAHKTGASFFLLSRILGAAVRLFLVADILDYFLFNELGVSFEITVLITLLLIYVYTYKGGIKTIVWTDTLQTTFMLAALSTAIYLIYSQLGGEVANNGLTSLGITDWFVTDNINEKNHWLKYILSGIFVSVAMTGLDQDMMQKNLTCKNTKDAQKNMLSFSIILFAVNFVFLILGALLFTYLHQNIELQEAYNLMDESKRNDRLFPLIALKGEFGNGLGITFLLGLIAAAYSSADSALTSLTTSASVDLFQLDKKTDQAKAKKTRQQIHIGMTAILFITILLANAFKEENVIGTLFKIAGYTYGPLLGLFFFGILTKRTVKDSFTLLISLFVPTLLVLVMQFESTLFGKYKIGYELLGINGFLCFVLLFVVSKSGK
ncbi:MAG: sodium:solute symporter [Lishizhenia sp.]